jgi:organic hydroperoxide reductase OsmC/OhrA
VLCAKEGVVVTDYVDHATGTLVETPDGSGHFEEVTLRPRVTIASAQHMDRATELHPRAHDMCFVANSVNFDVRTEPAMVTSGDAATTSGS